MCRVSGGKSGLVSANFYGIFHVKLIWSWFLFWRVQLDVDLLSLQVKLYIFCTFATRWCNTLLIITPENGVKVETVVGKSEKMIQTSISTTTIILIKVNATLSTKKSIKEF